MQTTGSCWTAQGREKVCGGAWDVQKRLKRQDDEELLRPDRSHES